MVFWLNDINKKEELYCDWRLINIYNDLVTFYVNVYDNTHTLML